MIPEDYSNRKVILFSYSKIGDKIFFYLFEASFSIKSSLEVRRVHVHLASYQLKEDYKTGQRACSTNKNKLNKS